MLLVLNQCVKNTEEEDKPMTAASPTHDLGLIIATLIHNPCTSGAPKVKESQIKAFSNEEARGYRKRFFKGK